MLSQSEYWSGYKTRRLPPSRLAANEVWVAVSDESLQSVLVEALQLEDLSATVMAPDRLRSALDSGALPRGLLLDGAIVQADPHILADTDLVDRLTISTAELEPFRDGEIAKYLRRDSRWLQKPFTLQEFYAVVRWLGEGVESHPSGGREDV